MVPVQEKRILHWLTESITFFFILLFFYAGLSKIVDGNKFFDNLNNSPIVGGNIAGIAEWIVPLAEFTVGFLLSFSRTRLKGMIAGLVLLFIFTGYIIGILFFSPYIPCSCGGVIALLSWKQHLLFNVMCIGLGAYNYWLLKKENKEYPYTRNHHLCMSKKE